MRLQVRVTPRATRERLEWEGQTLHVWVRPAAVEGAANQAMLRAVARWLGVASSQVRIVAGAHNRAKVVEVEGVVSLPALRVSGFVVSKADGERRE